jgi:hypothetical protein
MKTIKNIRIIISFLATLVIVMCQGIPGFGEIPVYRLYNTVSKVLLYSTDANEKAVLEANSDWNYEGVVWYGYESDVGQYPIYRLYSPVSGKHLFTMDGNEKNVLSADPNWQFEKIAWYANATPYSGDIPVYRLYSDSLKQHLYTADVNEKNTLAAAPAPPLSAAYPMFLDNNNNGINDYMEKDTHFSVSDGNGIWKYEGIAYYTMAAQSSRHSDDSHHGTVQTTVSNDTVQQATVSDSYSVTMHQGTGSHNHAFTDLNGDGVCDYGQNGSGTWHGPGFTDANNNGLCDYWDSDSPQYNHHQGMYFQDQNQNRINDYYESQWHDGHDHNFTDTNADGVCDYAQNGSTAWHGPGFTDGNSNGVSDCWDDGGTGHGNTHHSGGHHRL